MTFRNNFTFVPVPFIPNQREEAPDSWTRAAPDPAGPAWCPRLPARGTPRAVLAQLLGSAAASKTPASAPGDECSPRNALRRAGCAAVGGCAAGEARVGGAARVARAPARPGRGRPGRGTWASGQLCGVWRAARPAGPAPQAQRARRRAFVACGVSGGSATSVLPHRAAPTLRGAGPLSEDRP